MIKKAFTGKQIVELFSEYDLFLEQCRMKDADQYNTLAIDSRKISKNDVFIAIAGSSADGNNFIPQAIENGASLIVTERPLSLNSVPAIRVTNTRKAYSLLSQFVTGNPTRNLTMIGVTGTNGKTTTTFLIQSILNKAGIPAAVIGTTGAFFRENYYPLAHTTPDCLDLMNTIRKCSDNGAQVIVMEVSSHGIDQERIYGVSFDLGIFTNITQDHLDYHKDLDSYARVKWRFFEENCQKSIGVYNIDDPRGMQFYQQAPDGKRLSYGFSSEADIRSINDIISDHGMSFTLNYKQETVDVQLALSGRFNILNSLAASSIKEVYNIPLSVIKDGLESVKKVPGRLEEVPNKAGIRVFVDYAHTPDALNNVLKTLREISSQGRVILVFGCGGDRDKEKRPLMGEIAGEMADYSIITSDNPRTEKPESIVLDIVRGIQKITYTDYEVIFDRRKAIYHALNKARDKDIILIAGKGHEEYQEIDGIRNHFSDREEVEKYFADD